MDSLSRSVPSKDLRESLADVLSGVAYGSERVGVTRHGKLTAVVISVDDLELLEELEAARDTADFAAARAADDGRRVPLTDLRAEIA
ncbi:MAG: type II toxin-antitoxin system prevent-host-death family antitoxin [Microbacterium sp.]|nr:type II toxin-antitoxin system prevent-host-death family antitoxin [Microbacterium sp.]